MVVCVSLTKTNMNTNTFHPESILVLRDGRIDDEYYDVIYEEKRRQALRMGVREAIHSMVCLPIKLGRGVVYLANQIESYPQV